MTKLGNDTTSTRNKSQINGGTPVVFQMGTVPGTSTPIYWEVVYQTGDTITVWMTQPYTAEYFNNNGRTESNGVFSGATQTDYNIENGYSRSTLRQATQRIYSDLNAAYPVFSKVVKSPSNAGVSSWQSSQGNAKYSSSDSSVTNGLGTQTSTTNPHGWTWTSCMGDMFWIPSHYEVCNTSTSGSGSSTNGLWGLSTTDSAFTTTTLKGSVSVSYCWLRSGYSYNSSNAMQVGSSGSAGRSNVSLSYGVRPACHISLSALANAASYTITAQSNNANYGTVSGGGRVQVNSSVTLTATPQTGYHFVRWESNGVTVSIDASYTFTATASGTYTAIFEPNSYTITAKLSPAGAGTVTGGGSYNYNTQATLTASANNGYEFVGWDTNGNNQYDSGEPTANPYTFTVTGDATITAIFRQLINITIRTNNAEYGQIFVNGSLTTSTTLTQDANTQINNIIATPKANSAFLYWYDESNGNVYYDNPLNYTVTQTATLTAYFGSGLVEGVAVSVECPDTTEVVAAGEARIIGYTNYNGIDYVHFSAVAYTGYRFVGWRVDGEILADYTTESANIPYSIVKNKQVFAVFEPIDNSAINDDTDNGQTDDFV